MVKWTQRKCSARRWYVLYFIIPLIPCFLSFLLICGLIFFLPDQVLFNRGWWGKACFLYLWGLSDPFVSWIDFHPWLKEKPALQSLEVRNESFLSAGSVLVLCISMHRWIIRFCYKQFKTRGCSVVVFYFLFFCLLYWGLELAHSLFHTPISLIRIATAGDIM